MNKLKKTFSLRKKRGNSEEEEDKENEDDWQEDELRVRNGTCQFLLQYLGCTEVQDSKGIQVCEEAMKKLMQKCQGQAPKMVILQVKGEFLKGIDEATSEIIIDQPVEKVAFCSPDRNTEKGFAYISRDSLAKKWMCHGFLTIKDVGERVSYAVGYAFNVCMELRLAKEKQIEMATGEFKRSPSFKFASMTDRKCDPQVARVAEPIPSSKRSDVTSLTSIKRPRGPPDLLKRQSSFVTTSDNPHEGTFKRQLSLKVEELSMVLDQLNARDPKIVRNKMKRDQHLIDDDAFLDANNNKINNNNNKNDNDNDESMKPVHQENPWSSSATSSTTNKTIDPDDWLRQVAKKAATLAGQSETRTHRGHAHVTSQMRTQSVDFSAITAKLERQKNLKGSVNNNWNQSQEVVTKNDDPFDVGWAEGLANRGRNPFKLSNRTASLAGGKY